MSGTIGGSSSSAQSNSGALFTPNPDLFSQAYSGIYQRDMPGILNFLKKWVPQMEEMGRTQGGLTSQQDLKNMQQLLSMENANNQAKGQSNYQEYMQSGAPLQMAQSQVLDYNSRQKDPEYYNTRANTANQLNSLMSGQLNGSELSNIERGLNRQFLQNGTFNTPSNTQQLQAATTYGDAGRSRQMAAIGLAGQALPGFRTSEVAAPQASNRGISDALAKTDTSSTLGTTKMLFTNPLESATQSFNTALGIPDSSSASGSKDISL